MVSIQVSERDISRTLDGYDGRVTIAAVNSPDSIVISGDEDAVMELATLWGTRGAQTKRLRVSHAFHSPHMDAMLEQFAQVVRGIAFAAPEIAIVSNVTGQPLLDEEVCSAEYWVSQVRKPVRFCDGVRCLGTQGVTNFLELGPDGVLSALTQDCLAEQRLEQHPAAAPGAIAGGAEPVAAVPLLRGERPEAEVLLSSLAEVWTRGVDVDWPRLFEGSTLKRIALPTYAFQRERYWLRSAPSAGDVLAIGQAAADHPLLSAVVDLPNERGWLFTGRLSLEANGWLKDHAVMGTVLLPGTAFLELAMHVASRTGCEWVEELTLEAPLVLGEQSAVQLQVSVGELDEAGRRALAIYSRAEPAGGAQSEDGWTHHANGVLASGEPVVGDHAQESAPLLAGESWPPEGAQEVPVEDLYDELAGIGLEYGPVFQGLRAAWRRGPHVFAEVALPADQHEEAFSFGLHPALLDSAFHAGLSSLAGHDGQDGVRLPFSFSAAHLRSTGASFLRVALAPAAEHAISLLVSDEIGELVASIDSLALRPVSVAQLAAPRTSHHDARFTVGWSTVPLPPGAPVSRVALLGAERSWLAESLDRAGCASDAYTDLSALREAFPESGQVPPIVVVDCATTTDNSSSSRIPVLTHATTRRVLSLTQEWLDDPRFVDARLVIVTRNAVGVRPHQRLPGLAQAAVWGLVRSAQSENPDRLVLLDSDATPASSAMLPRALHTSEVQLALRDGEAHVPRVERADTTTHDETPMIGPQGTVLITGGTGALGALLARHLVVTHNVEHLLLVSRHGPQADGASELQRELELLGAHVGITACDVANREQLKELLDSIGQEYPLRAVVHAAGVLDDGVTSSLTAERVDRVLAPKADAAWHLHELTEHHDLQAFVLFSSIAATLGAAGQSNYAAANAFLDALATDRRACGLTGTAIAWGLWDQTSGMTASLSGTERSRIALSGLGILTSEQGLEASSTSRSPMKSPRYSQRSSTPPRCALKPEPACSQQCSAASFAATAAPANTPDLSNVAYRRPPSPSVKRSSLASSKPT